MVACINGTRKSILASELMKVFCEEKHILTLFITIEVAKEDLHGTAIQPIKEEYLVESFGLLGKKIEAQGSMY